MIERDLLAPILRVRRRLRLQAALESAVWATVLAGAGAAIAVYLWRLDVLARHGLQLTLAGCAAAIAVSALAGALERIPLARAAKRIDRSHGLHDRLGSALAFAADLQPSDFMRAAIADARLAARAVSPSRAAPFLAPAALRAALGTVSAALVIALLHFPAPPRRAAAALPPVPRIAVAPELIDAARAELEQLQQQALDAKDPETKALADELQRLLADLDEQKLTRKDAFNRLAQIEKKLTADADQLEALRKKLKAAGAELSKGKLTKETGKALREEDLEKAKKELEKLAAEAEKLDAQKRAELAKDLERPAEALKLQRDDPNDPERKLDEQQRKLDEQKKQLEEEQRQLKRKLEQNPKDEEAERRLKRNQRELERLEREKQAQAEQRRELQRLERELQKAAEQLRQKLSPEAQEALRKAAQQVGKMQDELRKLGNSQKTQVQIAELKEMLRRAGQSNGNGLKGVGVADGQNGQNGQNGQSGPNGTNGRKPRDGKGQNGKGGEKSLARDFNQRAGGQDPVLVLDGDNPQSGDGPKLLLPLPGGPGDQPGEKGNNPGQDQPGQNGDGIGNQHDPNLMGDKTSLASKRKDSRVQGKESAAPSRSETILGSAEKGFASQSYKRVYQDYTSVVEEVMSKERVPPGYRFYVKRYFQLIKPRE